MRAVKPEAVAGFEVAVIIITIIIIIYDELNVTKCNIKSFKATIEKYSY